MVEGGAVLVGSLIAEGLVDELRVFAAPQLIGDAAGLSPVAGLRTDTLAEAPRWSLSGVERIDEDVLLRYLAVRGESHGGHPARV